MSHQFVKNKLHGYWEVEPKPSVEELRQYYEDKYYQNESAAYSHSYSEEEIEYFNTKIGQKDFTLSHILNSTQNQSLLDIGCGEGFTLEYFFKKGWNVQGIDYSDFGIKNIHPHLTNFFIKGNIWETIEKLLKGNKKYDVVWLDNVLEHVVDPAILLKKAAELTYEGGILIIEVPNDYSAFQQALFDSKKINKKFWEAYPDHLAYFSRESLISLCENNNWKIEKVIGDFPIEWFLMNNHSNYCNDKSLGKQAHVSRIFLENFLGETTTNRSDLISFYESLSKINQGRQIIGFFKKQ